MIQASRISVTNGPVRLLSDVSLNIGSGEFVVVIGPNGAGKSTLLSVLSGERDVTSGTMLLDGRPMAEWSVGELARRRAVMLQHSSLAFAFTAAEVVALGLGRGMGEASDAAAHPFMVAAHVGHLAQRLYTTLSGGERQRVHFARTLAQLSTVDSTVTPFMLLDEPTSSLDPGHQHLVLAAARSWIKRTGGSVVAVLHDLTLAAHYGDRIVLLAGGKMHWQGMAAELPVDVLQEPYSLSFCRLEMPGGTGICYVPIP